MTGYTQVVNEPIHISGSQLGHVYTKNALLQEFHTKAIVENIFFSDHDDARIVFWKNGVDFTVSKQ